MMLDKAKASLHILKECGSSLQLVSDLASLKDSTLSTTSVVGVGVPVGCSVVEYSSIFLHLCSSLPSLLLGRFKVKMVDMMTAAATEFVHGWYSNMYDTSPMQLVLVHVHANCVQVGLAQVSPRTVDVLHVVETEQCSEEKLLGEATRVLASHIQDAVFQAYAWSPSQGTKWWSRGTSCLEPLAAQVLMDIGSKGECRIPYAYCPQNSDSVMLVDVRIGV